MNVLKKLTTNIETSERKGNGDFMMTGEEAKIAWEKVVKIYSSTIEQNNPEITIREIIKELGIEKTKEIFATVTKIKAHDGRIYGNNRKIMEAVETNPELSLWDKSNPLIYSGLDDIHTAHINNLITVLINKNIVT